MSTKIIIYTILAINIITFFIYGIDKAKAIKNRWRIPEKALLIWSLFAPWGAYAGMKAWHHKTNKKKFSITVPFFMVLHIALYILYVYYYR
ncbi:MAG: DUF1294 domain-containing protein [Eubacteriales bacterium]